MQPIILGRIHSTPAGESMPDPRRVKWYAATRTLTHRPKDGTPVKVLQLVKFAIGHGQKSGFVIDPGDGSEWGWCLIRPAAGASRRKVGI